MSEGRISYVKGGHAPVDARVRTDSAKLLGQVMFLVSVAIGFTTLGTAMGQDLSNGTGFVLFLVGIGMLFISSFVRALRVGTMAVVWLYSAALVLGLGLGPSIASFIENDPSTVTQAAGSTALITLAVGAGGYALSRDLVGWMRPVSFLLLGVILLAWGLVIFGSGGNPVISAIIGVVSAAMLFLNFNYLRKHGTEEQAVMLATGIFVNILNIFLSLLNILGNSR